jgi:hypothetical protein
VPLALRGQAYDAVESTVLSQSSNIVIDMPKIVASPFLTDATQFYVFYLNTPLKPFIFQAREPLSRGMKGLDDMETKDVPVHDASPLQRRLRPVAGCDSDDVHLIVIPLRR